MLHFAITGSFAGAVNIAVQILFGFVYLAVISWLPDVTRKIAWLPSKLSGKTLERPRKNTGSVAPLSTVTVTSYVLGGTFVAVSTGAL